MQLHHCAAVALQSCIVFTISKNIPQHYSTQKWKTIQLITVNTNTQLVPAKWLISYKSACQILMRPVWLHWGGTCSSKPLLHARTSAWWAPAGWRCVEDPVENTDMYRSHTGWVAFYAKAIIKYPIRRKFKNWLRRDGHLSVWMKYRFPKFKDKTRRTSCIYCCCCSFVSKIELFKNLKWFTRYWVESGCLLGLLVIKANTFWILCPKAETAPWPRVVETEPPPPAPSGAVSRQQEPPPCLPPFSLVQSFRVNKK